MPNRDNLDSNRVSPETDEQVKAYYTYQVNSLKKKRADRKYLYISALVAYLSMSLVLLVDMKSGSFNDLFSSSRLDIIEIDVKNLKDQDVDLLNNMNSLNNAFNSAPTTSAAVLLNRKVDDLENRQKNIEQSVLIDPDKALTARLLREKQVFLYEQMAELRSAQLRLDEKFDNMFRNILLAPLVTVFIGWLGNLIYKKFFAKDGTV